MLTVHNRDRPERINDRDRFAPSTGARRSQIRPCLLRWRPDAAGIRVLRAKQQRRPAAKFSYPKESLHKSVRRIRSEINRLCSPPLPAADPGLKNSSSNPTATAEAIAKSEGWHDPQGEHDNLACFPAAHRLRREGQVVEYEEVSNRGKTSAGNLKVQR